MRERESLQALRYGQLHKFHTFTATLAKFRYYDDAIMLANICMDGERMAEHVWIYGRDGDKFDFKRGTQVTFQAKIYVYKRADGSVDYGLRRIRKVKAL